MSGDREPDDVREEASSGEALEGPPSGDAPEEAGPADAPDGPAPAAESAVGEIRTPSARRQRSEPRRFPGWILVVLGGAAGGFAGGWWGLAFGALVGFLVWRSRAG